MKANLLKFEPTNFFPHPIMIPVLLVKKEGNITNGIPVPGHTTRAGEAHGDDAARHVCQVQVHAVLLVPALVLESKI